MGSNRKHAERNRVLEGFFIVGTILIMMVILIFINQQGKTGEEKENLDSFHELSQGWYRIEDGNKIPVTLPAEIRWGTDETLVLYNDALTKEDTGKTLTTKGARYDLKVSLGDRILYCYEDENFPRNSQMKSKLDCDADLPQIAGGEVLEFCYKNTENGVFRIQQVWIGSGRAVEEQHFHDFAASRTFILLMIMTAVFSMGIAVYLRLKKMKDPRFAHAAVFLLICAVWCITDSPQMQQNQSAGTFGVISFYAFMLLAVPMLHFVCNTGEMKRYRILDFYVVAFYLNAILQGLLNYLHIFDFIQMLFVTHLLLITGVAVCATLMIKEYKRTRDREFWTILLAFAVMAASGLLAIFLYWVMEIPYYGMIFELGIVIFVILLLAGIIFTMVENLHLRTEIAVYQRLAREDPLTGMKNRMAFDEFIAGFQPQIENCRNAALIFMDINNLKEINDQFGHNAGDEMIIAAARCIESTFAYAGTCYRIGGDEFCVLLIDPYKTEEEWLEILDKEVQLHNRASRYSLSISAGFSYLRDENGYIRTISDWKYEADKKMYESKGRKLK